MLRYAEAPYAHGIRKKSVPLRYARAQNAHVQFFFSVTLRNNVIFPRPFLKNRNVTQRRHMHTSNFKKKSRFVTQWRQIRSTDVEMTSKCPRPQKCFAPLRYGNRPNAHDPQKKILGYVTLARNMPMPTPCFLVLVTLRSASCPSVVYTTVMKNNNFWGKLIDVSAEKEAPHVKLDHSCWRAGFWHCGQPAKYVHSGIYT